MVGGGKTRLLFLVSEDWYFVSHRLDLARAALAEGYHVAVATRVTTHAKVIEDSGIELYDLGFSRGIGNPLADVWSIFRLLRRFRPHILHNVALKASLLGSLAAVLAGIPFVINAVSGLGYVFINKSLKARVLKPAIIAAVKLLFGRKGRVVLVQNKDDAALFETLLPGTRTVLIRGAGIDLDRFVPSPEQEGVPLAAAVSRLLWDKGIGELVEAARLLRDRKVPLRVALIGRPDPVNPRSLTEAEIKGWVAEGLVEWWGHRSDIPEIWRQAQIAVLPSYREGFPKALLEAAACGRPLVTTDVPGCNELVTDGDNGLLVPVREAKPLADALERLALDPALRAQLGRRARERAEQEFSSAIVIEGHLDLYRSLAPAKETAAS